MLTIANENALHRQLAAIDWSAPWWQPWRDVGLRVAQRVLACAQVCEALNAENSAIRFVPQSALPEGAAYEAFIYSSASVPTRENLHDFFNGLAWIVFPQIKRRLNQLQAAEISASGVRTTRGALRDALTLFDENAALWPLHTHADANTSTELTETLIGALRAKQWHRAFIDLRSHWHSGAPVLFGHALLEKLTTPYKSITAHVFVAQTAINLEVFNDLDLTVASQLSPTSLVPKPFIPLPVLGVPRWWADNENPQFYDDTQVFRAPRDH